MQSIDQKASRNKEMQLVSSSIFKAPSYRTVKMILILVSDFVSVFMLLVMLIARRISSGFQTTWKI